MKVIIVILLIGVVAFAGLFYFQWKKEKDLTRLIEEQQTALRLQAEAERRQQKPPGVVQQQIQQRSEPQKRAQQGLSSQQQAQQGLSSQQQAQQDLDRHLQEQEERDRRQREQQQLEAQQRAEAEAERQRKAALAHEEQERRRRMRTQPYVVDWFNDYASSGFDDPTREGATIDAEIQHQFELRHPEMIQVQRQQGLTPDNWTSMEADVFFRGVIRQIENRFVIELRVYAKAGKYLSEVVSTETRDRGEIAREYYHLAIGNFPFSGVVTARDGQKLKVALQGGAYLHEAMIANRKWRRADGGSDFELRSISFDGSNQLTAGLNSTSGIIQEDMTIVSVVRKVEPLADELIVRITDSAQNKLNTFQVWASFTKGSDGNQVGYTNPNGEINLSPFIQGDKTIYVTIKTGEEVVVGTFETSASKGRIQSDDKRRIHHVQLPIRISQYK